MHDQTKVQACWKALAPLARQATALLKERRKYIRQANTLTDISGRAKALTRSTDPEIVSEAWAVVRAIESLRPDTIAIQQQAPRLVIELEDVLPVSRIHQIEQEIVPERATLYQGDGLLFQICNGIIRVVSVLSEHCGPAPAGWAGAEGGTSFLVDDSEIDAYKNGVNALEKRQDEIDAAEQKWSQAEQLKARRNAEAELQQRETPQIDAQVVAEAKKQPSQQQQSHGKRQMRRGRDLLAVQTLVKRLHREGYNHERICERLGEMPRPPRAGWTHLSWPAAINHPEFRAAVKTKLSKIIAEKSFPGNKVTRCFFNQLQFLWSFSYMILRFSGVALVCSDVYELEVATRHSGCSAAGSRCLREDVVVSPSSYREWSEVT